MTVVKQWLLSVAKARRSMRIDGLCDVAAIDVWRIILAW